jgi:ABC-2 type transport system permease protein
VRLFLHELRAQQRLFWRSRELAFFTMLLPLVFFLLLGSVYGGGDEIDGVPAASYLLVGMLGYGAVATSFAGLAIFLVIRRESGVLKRVRATPLPPATYVAAVLCSTLLAFLATVALLLVLARTLFGVDPPAAWPSLAAALLLGSGAFAALGVGLASLLRSAEGSSAVVNAIYLPMLFLSGSFFSPDEFPELVRTVASVLPLTFFIALVRDVALEGEQLWESARNLLGVLAWGAVGLAVAVRRFRWEPRER